MSATNDTRPPKWPLRLLRFFLKKEYLEEIEGDMEELFYDNVERLSYRRAKRLYTREMLGLLRPALVKKMGNLQHLNQQAMFKNYFKVSIRSLLKNPLNAFINLFGLAVAIGICIFSFGFAQWTYSIDQSHEHKHEVYLATFFADRDGTLQQFGRTPRPLGEMLKKDFAQVKKVCRVEDRNVILKYGDRVFHERVRYVDPEFLELFTFPLKWGSSRSLMDANSIILSEEMAIKYFGKENLLGQTLLMKFDKDRSKSFKVTGVAKKFSDALTIQFDCLINFNNLRTTDPGYDVHDWNAFVNATLIEVDNPVDLPAIKQGMGKYKKIYNQGAPADWAISSFSFEQLATLNRKSSAIRDDISYSTDDSYKSVVFLVIIGAFMLVLACINYINIAIVSAAKRLKEIGVRKSIGATRSMIIVQFLSENIVTTFFALFLGLLFGMFVAIPWFEEINGFNMEFKLTNSSLWIYLVIILLFTGIVSGLYPSLYISRFHVVGILKGAVKFGKKNPLIKTFLVFQLILACMLITSAVMFTQNSSYLAHRGWGYNQSQALYVAVPDQAAFDKLKAVMLQEPGVLSVSGSMHHLGKSNTMAILHLPNRQFEADQLSVDAGYFETMGLQLKEGRLFKPNYETDKQTLIVNELFVQSIGLKNPVGQQFKIDSVPCEIIGVVKDFHNYSFYRAVQPTIFRVADKENYRFLSMKVRPGEEAKTYRALHARWAQLYPEIPFDGGYQEDVWGGYYAGINKHGRVWRVIATIAILLTSLGLYGLVKLNITGRVREFSIRKVLGAGIKNIANSISRQYVLLLIIALIIGAPASYIIVKMVIHFAYRYHMPFNYSGVSIAVIILIAVVLLTISTQIRRVLKSNPVNGLKVE